MKNDDGITSEQWNVLFDLLNSGLINLDDFYGTGSLKEKVEQILKKKDFEKTFNDFLENSDE